MEKVYEQWAIGSTTMKNRFVRSAIAESLCTTSGVPSKRLMDLYRGLVRGGVGMIITGYSYVCPDGKPSERALCLSDDADMDSLRALAQAVHERQDDDEEDSQAEVVSMPSLEELRAGAKVERRQVGASAERESGSRVIAQLVYGGSKSTLTPDDPRSIAVEEPMGKHAAPQPNVDIVGPSPIAHPKTGLVPREATAADIERIVKAFGTAATRAKDAGFDGVEVHAAHGYLLSQFLDGRFNKRDDEYGGSLENRARFALACVRAVRAQVGDDYPVIVKLNSCDVLDDPQGAQGGMTEEESLQVAAWLVEAGASCIEVSGDWHAVDRETITGEPFFGSFGTRLARRIDAPVIVTGGWRDPEIIERYLETTDIAAIGMGRPLISQPFLPELWSAGYDNKAECDSCNFCAKHNGIPCILRKGK